MRKEPLKIVKVGLCLEPANQTPHAKTGYIYVQVAGVKAPYHRTVWEQFHGPLLPKQVVRQICGNRRCCNINHLKIGQHGQPIAFSLADNGCHVCTSHKPGRHGYPQARDRTNSSGSTEHLHRIVWKRMHGEIAPGLVVRHKCDNRLCINPEHLELGSIAENSADMVARGRQARGAKSGMAKLSDDDVRQIRASLAAGELQKNIAAKFGVAQTKISAIKTGATWKHIQ